MLKLDHVERHAQPFPKRCHSVLNRASFVTGY
jgi:hypothetical protein